MDLLQLVNPGYLFEIQPKMVGVFGDVLTVYFGLLLLVGVAFLIFARSYGKKNDLFARSFRGLTSSLTWLSIGGFLFLFFRTQQAPYLSMRIWLMMYVLYSFYAIYTGVRSRVLDFSSRSNTKQARTKVKADNYLPIRRNKKR